MPYYTKNHALTLNYDEHEVGCYSYSQNDGTSKMFSRKCSKLLVIRLSIHPINPFKKKNPSGKKLFYPTKNPVG